MGCAVAASVGIMPGFAEKATENPPRSGAAGRAEMRGILYGRAEENLSALFDNLRVKAKLLPKFANLIDDNP